MAKDKKTKPSKELPLGFLDRKERVKFDLIISKIKEIMTVYGFNILRHLVSSIRKVLENFYLIKRDPMKVFFLLKMKIDGFHYDMI